MVAAVVETTVPRLDSGRFYLRTLPFLDGAHRVGRRVLGGGQREEAASVDLVDESEYLSRSEELYLHLEIGWPQVNHTHN